MILTAEILFCKMEAFYPLRTESVRKKELPLEKICVWEETSVPETGTFYVVNSEDNLIGIEKSENTCFLICSPGSGETVGKLCPAASAFLENQADPTDVLIFLLDLCNSLRRWDAEFSEAIFRHEDPMKVMSLGYEMLGYEYSIIDRNMLNRYSTPQYKDRTGESTMDRVASDVVQHLMLQPDFHSVAKLKKPFYYYEEVNDFNGLCRNLFLDDQYFARIVMCIGGREDTVPEGIMELYDVFAVHMERLIKYTVAPESPHTGDQLHYLFRAMVSEKAPDPAYCHAVLKETGWGENDTYVVIELRFFEEEGWNSQLDTALPYLIHELEGEWPNSCAISHNASILWLINTDMYGTRTGWEQLHQRAAFFVRDHVCHAGVSPVFGDFFLISRAAAAADAALQIGMKENPEFWYYLFDDYRLDYMLKKAGEDLPPVLLCHPALEQLLSHDRENGTELYRTLEAYLQNSLNMTAAAEKLYIHRTTFCRRMNQIRRLTGLDLGDPDTILTLLLSFRMLPEK